ncbi:hypothetical protein ACQEVB_04310 [Pseudonocardia sp. CA-107938]|uniref:hypothetical protein n=1 Tax=Pseudonocardia sp. CA-107938 TaxID=3240021 RepID=UPI003D92008B
MTDDEQLFTELAELLRPRLEPPPEVLDAARLAFGWRDAELARLVEDSLLESTAGTRAGGTGPRLLAFESGEVVVELQIDGRRVVGQVDPPAEVELELRAGAPDGPGALLATGRSDALGRFVLHVPAGVQLVTLGCTYPDGTGFRTSAVRL